MNLTTPLCERLGIQYPIIQAPIGGISNTLLAAAVSNAGGLGIMSGTWRSPEVLSDSIDDIYRRTDRPFGINFVLSFDILEKLEVCIAKRVPVISFFWGDPTPYISKIHCANALVMHTVGTAREAAAAAAVGVDIITAQGVEAGGHVCGNVGLVSLIPAVVDAIPNIPVVAAGGIADGRGLAAALCLGASGVMLGSRFVMSRESNAHSAYQEAIAEASEEDTVYAYDLFDGGWEHAPHRVLKNSTFTEWKAAGSPMRGSRPNEGRSIAWLPTGEAILRYSSDAPTKHINSGLPEAMALYCGQSAGLLKSVEGVDEIISRIMREAEALFQRKDKKSGSTNDEL